jgi:DNA-binding SARP family transcriptional activator
MRFRLLGVVEVDRDGTPVALGGPKPRTLPAALLLAGGRVLSVDRLISIIWDESPPESASALLHTYVSTLRLDTRRAFGKQNGDPGPGAILTQQPGYRIELSGCEVDTLAFTRLSAEADALAAAGDHEAAVSRYDQTLGQWRGPALGGLESRFATSSGVQ